MSIPLPTTRPTVPDPAMNLIVQDIYNKLQQVQQALTDIEARLTKLENTP